jgi:hypothetical protein
VIESSAAPGKQQGLCVFGGAIKIQKCSSNDGALERFRASLRYSQGQTWSNWRSKINYGLKPMGYISIKMSILSLISRQTREKGQFLLTKAF